MRNIHVNVVLLFLGLSLASCSSINLIQSIPPSRPIVVDGDASDWPLPLTYYDKETQLSFSVSNDSAKLYFCFQAFDQELQMKLVRGGLQIFFDTTGGSGKDISMLYPVPSTIQRVEPERSVGYGSSSDDFDPIGALRRHFFRSQPNEIQLTGFVPPASGLVPLNNVFGIEVHINWDTMSNVLNYEAAIPFAAFYRKALAPADSSKIIGLTFTVNGVARSGAGRRQEGSEGERGDGAAYPGGSSGGYPGGGAGGAGGGFAGGGIGHGGGGRHGGGSRGGSESSPLGTSQSLSIKLRLAKVS